MIDHLEKAALHALGVESEGAENDETEVGDRGVSNQAA